MQIAPSHPSAGGPRCDARHFFRSHEFGLGWEQPLRLGPFESIGQPGIGRQPLSRQGMLSRWALLPACGFLLRQVRRAVLFERMPIESGGTPYRSALSTFGPSMALAAPGCAMQICNKPKGSKPADCLATTLSYNCSKSGGHCTSTAC